MSIAKKIYWIISEKKRRQIENIFKYSSRTNLANKIIEFYKHNSNLVTNEVQEVLNFLDSNWCRPFPYSFKDEYNTIKITLKYDNDWPYVIHNEKKMYFKKSMSEQFVKNNYRALLAEQDNRSPHRYLTTDFKPNKGDIIIDVGAAEGIFALNHIDNSKKIFIVESDKEWIDALKLTFKPWKEKVEIIHKYASDISSDSTIALDDIYLRNNEVIDFIKMDIEGYEGQVLNGAANLLEKSKKLKLVVCTYHKQEDAKLFEKLFLNLNYNIEFSKGYMLSIYPTKSSEPYLRRGLIRATKQ